jgi:hypothetical protein
MTRILSQRVYHLFVIRNSDSSFSNTRRACNVCLLFTFAAFILNDFAERGVDVFRHATRVATNKEVRAFTVHPFPNFIRALQHFVLDLRFAVESRDQARSRSLALRARTIFSRPTRFAPINSFSAERVCPTQNSRAIRRCSLSSRAERGISQSKRGLRNLISVTNQLVRDPSLRSG